MIQNLMFSFACIVINIFAIAYDHDGLLCWLPVFFLNYYKENTCL